MRRTRLWPDEEDRQRRFIHLYSISLFFLFYGGAVDKQLESWKCSRESKRDIIEISRDGHKSIGCCILNLAVSKLMTVMVVAHEKIYPTKTNTGELSVDNIDRNPQLTV